MACVRARTWKLLPYWYMIDDTGKEHPCGPGEKGERLARAWAGKLNHLAYELPSGLARHTCVWRLKDLMREDLEDARRRGLRTAKPQLGPRSTSKRQSHWRLLVRFFGEDTNLDRITDASIRAYVEARERGLVDGRKVGPVPINRDLFGVLRPALALARDRVEESGYAREPFSRIRKLAERGGREPIALDEKSLKLFIEVCWEVSRPFGAYVELLRETASRLNERPFLDNGLLRYPAYKRGKPRAFEVVNRLTEIVGHPRLFSRKLWAEAVARSAEKHETPAGLRPHDIRHTALTLEGQKPEATLESIQKLGGWKDPAMAAKYLHPRDTAMKPLGRPHWRHTGGERKTDRRVNA